MDDGDRRDLAGVCRGQGLLAVYSFGYLVRRTGTDGGLGVRALDRGL